MKPKRPAKKDGRTETAQREETVRASAPLRKINPKDAIEELRTRIDLIQREWPDDADMQCYRMALIMAVDALAEKYGI